MDAPISETTVTQCLEALAAGVPSPAGGSAAALAGAMAAALAEMVCRVTLARRRRASSPDGAPPEDDGVLSGVLRDATQIRHELMRLATDDAGAYEDVVAAYRLPHGTPAEEGARAQAIQAAWQRATQTPLEMATRAGALGTHFGLLAKQGVSTVAADITVGTLLADAVLRGAAQIAEGNLRAIEDEAFCSTVQAQLRELLSAQAERAKSRRGSIGPEADTGS